MSSIKIVAVPPGQAPEQVRREWVGLVIPLPEQSSGGLQAGVLGGRPQNVGGYQVSTREALRLLNEKAPEAAQWFLDRVSLNSQLVFAKDVCEYQP